jgi:hypothetical protein
VLLIGLRSKYAFDWVAWLLYGLDGGLALAGIGACGFDSVNDSTGIAKGWIHRG